MPTATKNVTNGKKPVKVKPAKKTPAKTKPGPRNPKPKPSKPGAQPGATRTGNRFAEVQDDGSSLISPQESIEREGITAAVLVKNPKGVKLVWVPGATRYSPKKGTNVYHEAALVVQDAAEKFHVLSRGGRLSFAAMKNAAAKIDKFFGKDAHKRVPLFKTLSLAK